LNQASTHHRLGASVAASGEQFERAAPGGLDATMRNLVTGCDGHPLVTSKSGLPQAAMVSYANSSWRSFWPDFNAARIAETSASVRGISRQ
jgi:hypothetical protein